MAEELTDKQRQFVDEYIIDFNATQAAIRAGYSEKTAKTTAAQNLSKRNIQEALQKAIQGRSDRTQIRQDDVIKEWAKIAFYDPRDFFDENKKLKDITELDESSAAAIAGMDVTQRCVGTKDDPEWETITKIKLVDKKGALDSVAKHLGMFVDKTQNENTGKIILEWATSKNE